MLEYIVLFILLLGSCYWIINPLLKADVRAKGVTAKPQDILKELKHKKDGAYAAIRELEFDLSMGKLTEEDFQILKQQYTLEAVGYMQEIDKLELPPATSSMPVDTVLEKENEQGARAIRNDQSAQRKHVYCSSCGAKAAIESRFCTACGSKLRKRNKNYLQEEN
jgi:rRNA maturation endonuclease Nob1